MHLLYDNKARVSLSFGRKGDDSFFLWITRKKNRPLFFSFFLTNAGTQVSSFQGRP